MMMVIIILIMLTIKIAINRMMAALIMRVIES